jgi:PIN domain nuclease of toxin-antitoxin system
MNSLPLLLDTCAAIWIAAEDDFDKAAEQALNDARAHQERVYVSPITAWEIGLLVSRGRLNLKMSPERWFSRLIQSPQLTLSDMEPAVLIAASFLPGEPPCDPADRILAATAREYGLRLVTRDRRLLEYAEQGHIQALQC